MLLRTQAAKSAALWATVSLLVAVVAFSPYWSFPYLGKGVDAEVVDLNPANHLAYNNRYIVGDVAHEGSGVGSIGLTDYRSLKVGFRFRAFYHPFIPALSAPELPSLPIGTFGAALVVGLIVGSWRFASLGVKRLK